MGNVHFTSAKRSEADTKVTVYHPSGALNGHPDCFAWLEEVRGDIREGGRHIVLNLRDVTRIDSTGVGILASIHVSTVSAGGKLCLTGLNDKQRQLLEATWLLKVIASAEDEAQAIQACTAGG
jgi:anti-sigma B factor antagonist